MCSFWAYRQVYMFRDLYSKMRTDDVMGIQGKCMHTPKCMHKFCCSRELPPFQRGKCSLPPSKTKHKPNQNTNHFHYKERSIIGS